MTHRTKAILRDTSVVEVMKFTGYVRKQFHLASGRQKSDAMSYWHWKEMPKDGRICVMSYPPRKI